MVTPHRSAEANEFEYLRPPAVRGTNDKNGTKRQALVFRVLTVR